MYKITLPHTRGPYISPGFNLKARRTAVSQTNDYKKNYKIVFKILSLE